MASVKVCLMFCRHLRVWLEGNENICRLYILFAYTQRAGSPFLLDLSAGISANFASLFSKKPPPRTPDKCDPDLSFDAVTELQQEVLFFKDRYVNCPSVPP